MRLNKKGVEVTGTFLVILIISAIIISTLFFIFAKFTSFLGEGTCDIRDLQFLGDLPNKVELLSGPSGYKSREQYSFRIPCGDRAFLLDLNGMENGDKRKSLLGSLKDEPFLLDVLDSDSEENLFVMKGKEILASYDIGEVKIDYPYNICINTKLKRTVDVELEGVGKDGARIIPFCEQVVCTQVPEELDSQEIDRLVYLVCGANPDCMDKSSPAAYMGCAPESISIDEFTDCVSAEMHNIENAKGNIEVSLSVNSCFPETTTVQFTLKPKEGTAAKDVRFFETVPKECVENFDELLKEVEGGEVDVLVNPDPMLIWTFSTISEEQKVSYKIGKFLTDECRHQLRATAGAELIVKEEAKDKEIHELTDGDLAPITDLKQKHITRLSERKPHKKRFHPDPAQRVHADDLEPYDKEFKFETSEIDEGDSDGVLDVVDTNEVVIDISKIKALDSIHRFRVDTPRKCRESSSSDPQQGDNFIYCPFDVEEIAFKIWTQNREKVQRTFKLKLGKYLKKQERDGNLGAAGVIPGATEEGSGDTPPPTVNPPGGRVPGAGREIPGSSGGLPDTGSETPTPPGSENRNPEIEEIEDVRTFVKLKRTVRITATDLDVEDTLVYSLTTSPPGMTITQKNNNLAEVEWRPTTAADFDVVVKVEDGKGGEDTEEFKFKVRSLGSG